MKLRFSGLWENGRWLEPAYVEVDAAGKLLYLGDKAKALPGEYEQHEGYALPGMINSHSHAFQYAMAGMSESLTPEHDSFWTWREKMYQLALSLDPDGAFRVAAMLYAEMLRLGYTHVVEFHYLHHDPNGKPYDEPAAMAESLMRAAQVVGIGITMVPIYYETGDFGRPASDGQRRFLSKDPAAYWKLWEATARLANTYGANLGWGWHSLRACPKDRMHALLKDAPANLPIHLHIAEQEKEVRACESYYGKRPIEWLCGEVSLDARFHLVHSTHGSTAELKRLLSTQACVILCPSTEGNLGDGFFDSTDWQQNGGRWAIGTDSHIGLQVFEELRWLEYGARLQKQRRNVLCAIGNDCGETLFEEALGGGASAGGLSTADLRVGESFSVVVWDAQAPLLAGPQKHRLSQMVFALDSGQLYGTFARGKWQVKKQRHEKLDAILPGFQTCLKELWENQF
ncbi:MAG: formimidoylglutamate deiminase [Bdellovibrionales bacterium]|nr:formimidoylglutamate deiminase [Bdellovibrionales bacterium]